MVGEESDTLEEVYEPYLIMEGYLQRTPQGRVATDLARVSEWLPDIVSCELQGDGPVTARKRLGGLS